MADELLMVSRSPVATRVVATMVAAAVVTSACGPTDPGPDLVAVEEEQSGRILFVAEPDGEVVPEPRRPELIGLDDAMQSVRAANDPSAASPSARNRGLQREIGDETVPLVPVSDERARPAGGDLTSTGPAAAAGDDVASAGAQPEAERVDGTEEDVAVDPPIAEATLPPPPPPVAPSPARYDDPSELLVTASGRPFPPGEVESERVGVTASTIRVGGLVTRSLAGLDHRPDLCLGARARFEQANHHRELSRRIEMQDCYDDTGQFDLNAGLTRALVRDDVMAVVPMASPVFDSADVLREASVPYFGAAQLPAFCGRENAFGFGTWGAGSCPVLAARGYVAISEPVLTAYSASVDRAAAPRITYVVEDGPRGDAVAASRRFEAELLGVPTPRFAAVLPTLASGRPRDWAPVVDHILDGSPEVVILDGGAADGLVAAVREAGFAGELVWVGRIDPAEVRDPERRVDLAPLTVISPGVDLASRATPGWVALAGAGASVGLERDAIGLDFIEGYLAADMFVQAVAATPEPLSGAALAARIDSGWWYPGIDGLTCGSWWPASHLATAPCVSVARVDVFTDRLVPVLGLVETEPQLRFELR